MHERHQSPNLNTGLMPKVTEFSAGPGRLSNMQVWLVSKKSDGNVYFHIICYANAKIPQILNGPCPYAVFILINSVLRGACS